MAASARLMVLMSPEERASLNTKARTLGVSAGEVVRRAVQAFELGTEEEAAELRGLIDVFNQLHNVRGVPDATPEALCNDNSEQTNFLDAVGGSGGASNCTTVDDSNTAQPCSDGHPKPSWQSGVAGFSYEGIGISMAARAAAGITIKGRIMSWSSCSRI